MNGANHRGEKVEGEGERAGPLTMIALHRGRERRTYFAVRTPGAGRTWRTSGGRIC